MVNNYIFTSSDGRVFDYEPKTLSTKLARLVEECGEVLAAAGKIQRFGLCSVNPELPEEKQEPNYCWLLREIQDLKQAIEMVELAINKETNEKACDKKPNEACEWTSEDCSVGTYTRCCNCYRYKDWNKKEYVQKECHEK